MICLRIQHLSQVDYLKKYWTDMRMGLQINSGFTLCQALSSRSDERGRTQTLETKAVEYTVLSHRVSEFQSVGGSINQSK